MNNQTKEPEIEVILPFERSEGKNKFSFDKQFSDSESSVNHQMIDTTVQKEKNLPIDITEAQKGPPNVQKEQKPLQDYRMTSISD